MASPSAESCPEPIAYSSNNSYADIDFTEPAMAVFTAQPKFVEVDSILSNQLGPVTNPVTTNAQPQLPGSPVLPFVNQSNAAPVVDSAVGADVNYSSTLENNIPSLAVNSISAPSVSDQSKPAPKVTPQSVAKPVAESFNNNLAKYIKSKEHFGHGKTILDNVVLFVIIAVAIFYFYSMSPYYKPIPIDLSKVPLIGSLTDNNVSDNNKLMIVAGILIAIIVISRLLK
jgi:hypothetical protein